MTGPRELLHRASENRKRAQVRLEAPHRPAREDPPPPQQTVVQSYHPNYTALMHSHDRMRTRHLAGQAGKGRA